MIPTVAAAGSTIRRYQRATDHAADGLDAQYVGSMDPDIRPRPDKRYPTLLPIPLPGEFAPSSVRALDALANDSGDGASGQVVPDLAAVARLCFYTDGITRRLRRGGREFAFRAAPCTGALYHTELYLVCGDLPGLAAGVYHYGVHDHALRQLRSGDFRAALTEATGGEAAVAQAPLVLVTTSVFWRNAWKYANRAYRHTYWDTGTMLPNTLAVAAAHGIPARLVLAFADRAVADLIGVDLDGEGVISLVALGRVGATPPPAPPIAPLDPPTDPYSVRENDYPLIRETHRATLLSTGAEAAAWRSVAPAVARPIPIGSPIALPPSDPAALPPDPIETVILRRGSSRRFARDPIDLGQLSILLDRTTSGFPSDALGSDGVPFNNLYLLANAVDGLPPGAYVYRREHHALEPIRQMPEAAARQRAHHLAWDQDLGGDAAVNVYFLADLDPILAAHGERGYRLAQLGAALVAGRMYLAAYALGLGATGLTFLDDETVGFFSPRAAASIVTFLIAAGHPATS